LACQGGAQQSFRLGRARRCVEKDAKSQKHHLGIRIKAQRLAVVFFGGGKVTDRELHLRQDDQGIESIRLGLGCRPQHGDGVWMPTGLRQNPAQMDLHMRLIGAQGQRAAQQLLGFRKPVLMFADQAQQLQSVRFARMGGKQLRQQLPGLLPPAMPDQVRGLQKGCGNEIRLHGREYR
jgi:hypothetical protein